MLSPTYKSRFYSIVFLIHKHSNRHSDILLDLGCGRGDYLKTLSFFVGKIIGIDLSLRDLHFAKVQHKFTPNLMGLVCADARYLPLKTDSITKICCVEVLHYVKEDNLVIEDLSRILMHGGQGYITVPNFNHSVFHDFLNWIRVRQGKIPWKIGIHSWGNIERFYRDSDLSKLVKSKGLRPLKTFTSGHYFVSLFQNYFVEIISLMAIPKTMQSSYLSSESDLLSVEVESLSPVKQIISTLTDLICVIDNNLFSYSKKGRNLIIVVIK